MGPALFDNSLDIASQMTAIIGPSGCGSPPAIYNRLRTLLGNAGAGAVDGTSEPQTNDLRKVGMVFQRPPSHVHFRQRGLRLRHYLYKQETAKR
jgi:ABC-type phosphate transport system ATPase subunit